MSHLHVTHIILVYTDAVVFHVSPFCFKWHLCYNKSSSFEWANLVGSFRQVATQVEGKSSLTARSVVPPPEVSGASSPAKFEVPQ